MAIQDLGDWLDEQAEQATFWWVKRLSANDTQATGGHQAGPLIPKDIIFEFLPDLDDPTKQNPKITFSVAIDSHADLRAVTATWYNNRLTSGQTRNEARITNWGGSASPLLDPEATGALVVFTFHKSAGTDPPLCHVWVCDNAVEEDRVTDRIGPVEPGKPRRWPTIPGQVTRQRSCFLEIEDLPTEWLQNYPTGLKLLDKVIELISGEFDDVDKRLARRWDCGYDLFRSLEEAVELPRVQLGYGTMGEFLNHAQTVLQRRRSRAGGALELNVRQLLLEEQFREGEDFEYKPESEANSEPDFLFPNAKAYHDPGFPSDRLRMLGVKTTLRDRWRQVTREADRITHKHVLTLEQGVSADQFRQIQEADLQLVVPASLHSRYPPSVRPYLQTLESFIGDLRLLR